MKKIGLVVFTTLIIIIAGVFSVIYFNNPKEDNPNETLIPLADDTNATADSVNSLVDSLNTFSLDFYNEIIDEEDGNIFFSPYSIFTAFSMAYEGADGNTADEMKEVLNILQNDSKTLGSFGRIYNLLNQNQVGYKISTANAFWKNYDYFFLDSYINILKNFYMAEANELDFSKNVEAAETINTWIEEQTNGKIKDLIEPDILSEVTKLVLTNAIYFKGDWAYPFNKELTYESDFTLDSNDTKTVDMMVSDSENSVFNYTTTDELQIIELPYYGNEMSMIIVLPKENNITAAESVISAENITTWKSDFYETEITVKIPKFKFETKYLLNSIMQNMGMLDAFTSNADFSKMDGTRELFISKALHQAYIDVNEEGTEAAAATAIVVELKAIPDPKEFTADHPFIFLIEHKPTDSILFMGKVMDPSIE